ncbi:MAG: EAL domain-containing protein [Xenococcaceae cyanobacterium]
MAIDPNSLYQSLQLEDVIDVNPPICNSQMKVMDVMGRMNRQEGESYRRLSYILVLEESKLVGILTERDIVKLTAAEIDLTQIEVSEVMTKKLITLKKSDFVNIYSLLTILRSNQIRHLPIVDDLEQLEGIVSIESICQALHPSTLLKSRRVEEAMTTEVVQAAKTASVLSLSQLMAETSSSCVVIVENKQLENNTESTDNPRPQSLLMPIGIVTERDIVQFQLLGLNLVATTAQTVMSTPLVCMKTTDFLLKVRQQMEKLLVRRLVIVGEQGELRGIITQSNILKVLDPTELLRVIETLQQDLDERTQKLQQEKELAQVTLQSIGDAVITTDAVGKIVNINPMAEQLTGWSENEAKGKNLSTIFHIINEYTRKPAPNPVEKVLKENKVFGLANHTILIARNGTEYGIEDSAAPIRDRQGKMIGAVIVFHDVTESRRLTRLTNQLSWQASHDALTGLYNRRKFEQKLVEAIASAHHEEQQHALCYLDLDQFKIVNDTCGHQAGDELLRQITRLLSQQVRSSDILARLGGDEFGLLLHRCPLEIAIQIANNLIQLVEDFGFTWQDKTFTIGVSIGLVEIESSTENLDSLMSAADAACYAAKARGRNCVHIYQNNDAELSRQRGERQWIAKLNQALSDNRFCLYSQKIISLKDSTENIHYEILIRLRDEQGQLILPGTFIPAAEHYNLMPAIDRWVINHFFTMYERYSEQEISPQSSQANTSYSINLSGASINNKQFHLFLQEQFTYFRIDPTAICFEITETAAISNLANASVFIQELKKLGCSIALDDFGSGMSSLTYLKNLPVDYLKIDGSFVKNIVSDKVDCTAVECFNNIGKSMNIKTVAEFVEDEAILEKLREIGVDYAQGYGIDLPKPLTFN